MFELLALLVIVLVGSSDSSPASPATELPPPPSTETLRLELGAPSAERNEYPVVLVLADVAVAPLLKVLSDELVDLGRALDVVVVTPATWWNGDKVRALADELADEYGRQIVVLGVDELGGRLALDLTAAPRNASVQSAIAWRPTIRRPPSTRERPLVLVGSFPVALEVELDRRFDAGESISVVHDDSDQAVALLLIAAAELNR